MIADLNKQIQQLTQLRNNNVHKKYIEYIRYPYFRNLEENTKITFDFPITFLVGKNGGGKSSTLQSLYGCPQGKSLGDYWFTTQLDPIKEFEKNRNCFIYCFKENGVNKEVIKQRIFREGNPDYWETAKPIKKYSMNESERNSPIKKNVIYLDFRSELSAFDKFFHFLNFSSSKHKSKQDYLRHYSRKLKQAFEEDKIIIYRNHIKNKPKIVLSAIEVNIVSKILKKNFESIEIIEHNLFKDWGISIRLKQKNFNYSEAFAGSGETAIVILVHKIFNAEDESLILLDEPETSLHSGAQKRLIEFLLEQSIKKKHQIIISTHSPFMIDKMPDNAIKVFSTLVSSEKFIINNDRNYKEAFHELEISSDLKKTILVEDKTAKIILDKILENLGDATKEIFEIKDLPGGADDINQRLTTLMEVAENAYVFFDGDQKKETRLINLEDIPINEQDTSEKLNKLIETQTGCKIKFYLDGGNQSREIKETQLIETSKKYLKYYYSHVFYLPMSIPEDIIWDDIFAEKHLKLLHPEKSIEDIKRTSKNSKDLLYNYCLEYFEDKSQYNAIIHLFTKNWLKKEDLNYKYIVGLFNSIK